MKENSIYNYCHVVGCTDVGCKRQANEDSMGSLETINGLVAVVCDGMGGHVGGATASRIAVETILSFLNSKYYEDPRLAIGEAIDAANQAILHQGNIQSELKGMGSTCVLLLVRDGKVYIGHIGDSRIYLVRNRRIRQLTKDHSYVQMLVDMRQLSPEQAEHHPRKNEITNALGIADMKPATVMPDAMLPEAGDCFLLCSDGLSGMVSDREIEKVISRQSEMRAQERADCLIRKAKENGGLDNITVQLVEFSVAPSVTPAKKKKWSLFVLLAVIGGMLIGGGIYAYLKWKPEVITRREKMIVLPPVQFEQDRQILEVNYGNDGTKILVNKVITWSDSLIFSNDSLKCEKKNISLQYNNSLLQFKQEFMEDTLFFSLANAEAVYKFKVPVLAEKDKNAVNDTKSKVSRLTNEPQNKEKRKAENNDGENDKESSKPVVKNIISALITMTDSISYPAKFKYEEKKLFLIFEGGNRPYYDIPGYNKSSINFYFTVGSVLYDTTCVRKEEKEGKYLFYFTKEPAGDLKMIFNGRKKSSESDSLIAYNVIVNLQKIK